MAVFFDKDFINREIAKSYLFIIIIIFTMLALFLP